MNDLKHFKAQAIIFDKDGTLIDFDAMWGGWVLYLAEQLRMVSELDVRAALCLAMGYDETNKKVLAHGRMAASPMAELYQLTVDVVRECGLSHEFAVQVVEKGWCVPDPVISAKQFTDTRDLFRSLNKVGIKVCIATSDDRAPTQAMIEAFDIGDYITDMVCADDGIPAKPAPDMVTTLCARMNIQPAKVMVVGDTISDMKMSRSAGAGLVVGVLSGVSTAKDLIPYADVLLDSVDDLHRYADVFSDGEIPSRHGLDPDFVF